MDAGILSASRRTDIPAFYMPWFMEGVEKGKFEVQNPYNRRVREIPATPDQVHTIVFWSKNYGPFLAEKYGEALQRRGYHLFFNFTINSMDNRLEPRVPALSERLDQLGRLCGRFGAASVQWRFDPICHYYDASGALHHNLGDFKQISEAAAGFGVLRCITSFMDFYRKIERRTAALPDLNFFDPQHDRKVEILLRMEGQLDRLGMALLTCCEREVLAALPSESSIKASACIPGEYLRALYGGRILLQRDRGQRIRQGCGCTFSWDIGSYPLHPCHHSCRYCYANPAHSL